LNDLNTKYDHFQKLFFSFLNNSLWNDFFFSKPEDYLHHTKALSGIGK